MLGCLIKCVQSFRRVTFIMKFYTLAILNLYQSLNTFLNHQVPVIIDLHHFRLLDS